MLKSSRNLNERGDFLRDINDREVSFARDGVEGDAMTKIIIEMTGKRGFYYRNEI